MKLNDFLKISLISLKSSKRRTFLTVSGIVIGVSAVIVIMSVGAGAESLILDQIVSSGSNTINILPGFSDPSGPPASAMGISIDTLKKEEAVELEKKIKDIDVTSSYVRGVASVKYQNKNSNLTFVGTDAGYQKVDDFQMLWGRFIDDEEADSYARSVVLGYGVYENFFNEGRDPVGERIKIKNQNYRIVGVVEKRGVEFFQNQDDLVYIPLKTAQKIVLGIDHISGIKILVNDQENIPLVKEQVEEMLKEMHNIEASEDPDFSVRAFVDALEIAESVTQALKIFLVGIAGISLLVGGIGIMNIMLVTVNERTREIGLRKSLGATSYDIQNQFLVEAIVVTFLGGILGIMVGVLLSWLISIVANYMDYNWVFEISPLAIIIGLAVASLTGILFGWYPARNAAQLEPIEALHYE